MLAFTLLRLRKIILILVLAILYAAWFQLRNQESQINGVKYMNESEFARIVVVSLIFRETNPV